MIHPYNIKLNHKVNDNDKLIDIWLVGVKIYEINPITFIIIIYIINLIKIIIFDL